MRGLKNLFVFLFLILSTTLITPTNSVLAQDKSEQSVVVEVAEEAGQPIVSAISVEDSLKICKDEAGNVKACSNEDLVSHLMLSIGGFKGMSALAIAFVISKFILLFLLSPFFKEMFPKLEQGRWKLFIAVSLNLVVGILALMIPPTSLSFGAAIMHSSVLALLSVFANQSYKQFFTSKGKA